MERSGKPAGRDSWLADVLGVPNYPADNLLILPPAEILRYIPLKNA